MTHDPRPRHSTDLLNGAVVLPPAGRGPELGEIRRRRRARRAATACAGVITAAVIVAGMAAAAGALPGTGTPTDSARDQVGAAAVPAAARPAGPFPTEPAPTAPAEPPAETFANKPVGELIKTDTAHSGGKLTLWFSESHDGRLHLSLGARDGQGELRSFGSAVALSRLSTGATFRAAYNAVNGDSEPREYALVGIVTGDVSRVTLTVDGKPRTARVAPWSEDPRVHAWWVLGDKLERWPGKSEPLRGAVSDLTAYGPDGKVVARDDDSDIAHG